MAAPCTVFSSVFMTMMVVLLAATADMDIRVNSEGNYHQNTTEDVSRIFGGSIATIEKFPWHARVMTEINGSGYSINCGASIISKTWVMSAAHCIIQGTSHPFIVEVTRMWVAAGITDLQKFNSDPDRQTKSFNKNEIGNHLFINPSYNSGQYLNNDIALIKLKTPFILNDKVQPIALAGESDFIPGKELKTSGWGPISAGQGTDILHYVDGLKLRSREYCQQVGFHMTDKMICHSTGGRNICSGDSGGAVVTGHGSSSGPPYVQIGINSWTLSRECGKTPFAAFTDVAKFRNWIDKTMSSDCSDRSQYCKAWADNGVCPDYPAYMNANCKKSCQLCSRCTRQWQFLSDPSDCSKYIVCQQSGDGQYTEIPGSCTSGYYFNPDTYICDSPKNVPSCKN